MKRAKPLDVAVVAHLDFLIAKIGPSYWIKT
jgi:hypothetical protein